MVDCCRLLITASEIGLPLMGGYETIPPRHPAFAELSSAMAFLSKLMAQKDLSDADK